MTTMKPLLTILVLLCTCTGYASPRKPKNDAELRQWLENMVWYHGYSPVEVESATGLAADEVTAAMQRLNIERTNKPERPMDAPLLVLPYPGGRHPRIGFLDGAVDPQRETKLSIFAPWDAQSYVVMDVPEAIWSNLGLTYLAHTHVPTLWSRQNVTLPQLEWEKLPNGDYRMERTLPNGILFGTQAKATPEAVLFKMWLSNGTSHALSDLRVQNCLMLKGAAGFNAQSETNKVLRAPFAAAGSGERWIITGWKPIHRPWANPPVPCLHADPKFPDTAPGAVATIHGIVTFFTGRELSQELDRLDKKSDYWNW